MKPTKQAVACLITESDSSRILIVKRPLDDEDLPGAWGLPAGRLRSGETHEDAIRRLGPEKLGVELRVDRLLRKGSVERDNYALEMKLFSASISDGQPAVPQPAEEVTQYIALDWAGLERLRPAAAQGSLCSRLALDASAGR